jgi:N4-gp56 family major capsid protein
MAVSELTNMVDPQVMADMISAKLPDKLRFAPLARIDTTLVGRPGSTLTVPKYNYVGPAIDIAEGVAIVPTLLETTTEDFTIKKAGKGVEVTDEAILSGLGNPLGEAGNQLLLAIADKIDDDCVAAMATTTLEATPAAWTLDAVSDAIDLFGDEDDNRMVLVMNPLDASILRKAVGGAWERASDLGDDIIVRGTYGAVLNAQVVRSNKLEQGTGYIIKLGQESTDQYDDANSGALAIYMKRDVEVESDRDILAKTTVITADEHYGAYLYDESKCVKITITVV